jgi:hypothetical protein
MTVMQFLHRKTAILTVYILKIGQYTLPDANADPGLDRALAVRIKPNSTFTGWTLKPMTNSALRFFKHRSTLEYRRYRKKLSFLDS